MINNDLSSHLNRYFNRSGKNDANSSAADLAMKRLKARQEAMTGEKAAEGEAAEDTADISMPAKQGVVGRGVLRHAAAEKAEKEKNAEKGGRVDADGKKNKGGKGSAAGAEAEAEEELSPMERRERELKAIMDKINAEEAMRYPGRNKPAETGTETAVANSDAAKNGEGTGLAVDSSGGIEGFLNDMPLFNEFKTGLMDAFSRLDGASMGAISAQYELNYTTMQYVANDLGGFEYQEQAVSVKLDLNYIKAAAGGQSGKEISEAIGKSEDFASLVENLQNVAAGQEAAGGAGQVSPDDFLASMQDYFSPEKTAERIVDFSSAFFGNSEAFRKYGDTEEGRSEFAETMRKAIQKGFDQAMGTLGKVPQNVQDGIDKTHELTFKGIDDFVKNGLNRNKQDNGVYNALEQFGFSFQMSYSSKTVSVSSSSAAANGNYGNGNANGNYGNHYGNYANKPAATSAAVPGVDAQA